MRAISLIFAILLSSTTLAKDFNNGCGSGWNEPIVPDKIGPLCIDFKAACAAHDNCYSKCLEGGENFGKPICSQTATEQEEGRRLICDEIFLQEATDGCANCDLARRPVCKGVAVIYKVAIRVGGKGNFNGIVSDGYYDFITSEKAKNFDFSAFEKEINDVRLTKGIEKSNMIKIDVRNGAPIAEFTSITPIKKNYMPAAHGLYSFESIKYGNVDLSKAANGTTPVKLDNLNIEALDINKIKIERSFSATKP